MTDTADPTLAELFHHRWNVPTLVALRDATQRRVAVLQSTLDASRNSLRASLAALRELGLVARNPGYGHPLRPELALTPLGATVADECADFVATVDRELAGRKWTASVLAELEDTSHFGELEGRLGISPRALSQALTGLIDAGLVTRHVVDGRPPRTEYRLTPSGGTASAQARDVATALSSAP